MRLRNISVFLKSTGERIKPMYLGDICVGEDVVILRDYEPSPSGGYVYESERVYMAHEVIVTFDVVAT